MKEDQLYNPRYQDIQNQAQFTKTDLRGKVHDLKSYPYNAIGKIYAQKAYQHQGKTAYNKQNGMGCLIHPQIVLTVAHVVYFQNLSQYAKDIEFHHISSGKIYKVNKCEYNKKYTDKTIINTEVYDVAILHLQQPVDINEAEVIFMNDSHKLQNQKDEVVQLVTIKKDGNKIDSLYRQKNAIRKINNQKLFYIHTTQKGDSGTVILIKQNESMYSLIGIHKGSTPNINFGLNIKSLIQQNQFLASAIKQYDIKTLKDHAEIQRQFKQYGNTNKGNSQVKQDNLKAQQTDHLFKKLKILKDPNVYLQIFNNDNQIIANKNKEGNIILLNHAFCDIKSVPDFFQYDWNKTESLFFGNSLKTHDNLKWFFENGSMFESLKLLQISTMKEQFGDKGMHELVECKKLGNFPQLNHLKFNYDHITVHGIREFAKNAKYFTLLQTLDCAGNQFGVEGIQCLNICVSKLTNLKQINLDDSKIGFQQIKSFTENGEKWKHLQRLYLNNNQLGDKQFRQFCQNAYKFENLEYIIVTKNKIGNEGWRSFVENWPCFLKLKILDISLNNITQIKSGQLDRFPKLVDMDFGDNIHNKNKLTKQSIKVLKKYQKDNPKVTIRWIDQI